MRGEVAIKYVSYQQKLPEKFPDLPKKNRELQFRNLLSPADFPMVQVKRNGPKFYGNISKVLRMFIIGV